MQCEWMVCGVVAIQGLSSKWYLFKFMCFLCNGLGGRGLECDCRGLLGGLPVYL
jgi:hypothetical protein